MELGLGTIVYEFAGVPLSAAIPRIADFGLHYLDVLAFGIFNPALYPCLLYTSPSPRDCS